MLMIPTENPADELIELPDGPQLLAARLWGPKNAPEKIAAQALAWLPSVVRPVRAVAVAIEAIGWAQGLPFLMKILGSDNWLALAEFLSALTGDANQETLPEQPLVHQLLAAELALTLSSRLSDAPLASGLQRSGRAAVALGLGEILDRQGLLPARHWRSLRGLLACWTRCRALAAGLPGGALGPRPEQRYQRFVRNALRATRPDGQLLLAGDDRLSPGRRAWGQELFEGVLAGGVDDLDRSLAAAALPALSSGVAGRPPKKGAKLPPPSVYSEENAVAVMRRNWNRDDERLAVLFAGQDCELELACSGRVAVSGKWQFEVCRGGQPLETVAGWEVSCWYSDEEVNYLELEIELAGGVKLQRHIVFARDDRFLLLADAVLGEGSGGLEYRGVLPMAGAVEFRGAEESREGLLVEHRRRAAAGKSSPRSLAQVLPLALGEWRSERGGGELTAVADGLELRQTTHAGRLFAPLFFDLDRSRFRSRMTWRQLTVAEWLAPVPPDVAVGYRVAVADRQWIIYRSLAAKSNRTLLGHNLATESLVARFGKDGEVASIVEIE